MSRRLAIAALVGLVVCCVPASGLQVHKLPRLSASQRSPASSLDESADAPYPLHWDGIPNPALAEILLVPKMRFLFCFIPKNACTQFNRLMNELNGIVRDGAVCSPTDPNYISSWGNMMPNMTVDSVKALIKDPTWKKGVFLRDPLTRLVSAYQSKCLPPQECGGCMNFEEANEKDWPNFDEFASKLDIGENPHFDPQSSLCGGLADTIDDFDFVGEISTNYSGVAEQVGQMLNMALQHSDPSMGPLTRSLEARALANKFFASTGPLRNVSHVHASTVPSDYYHDPDTLAAALHHYDDDYRTFPGLKVPDWALELHAAAIAGL